jgi:hypothetical protein
MVENVGGDKKIWSKQNNKQIKESNKEDRNKYAT